MYADSRVAFDNAYRNNGKSIAKWQKKKIGKILDLISRPNSVDYFIKPQGFLVVCHIIVSYQLVLFRIYSSVVHKNCQIC